MKIKNTELKEKIQKLLDTHKTGTMATVRNNRPFSRYMDIYNEELTIYTATNKKTHKVGDLEENPYVHILMGYEGDGVGDTFLEIEGKATISEEKELKEKVWNDDFEKWFKGPDDPNYIVLEIKPELIRYMNVKDSEPQELKL